jgi:hypothetical protein
VVHPDDDHLVAVAVSARLQEAKFFGRLFFGNPGTKDLKHFVLVNNDEA